MKKIFFLVWTILLMTLVGCSSNVSDKSYFQLENSLSNLSAPTARAATKFIYIESIDVASFLNKSGIVFQIEDIKYTTAANNLWTASLSQQLAEKVVHDLTILLPNYLIATKPITTPTVRVKLFIDSFNGSYTGDAIIKGRWVVTKSNNQIYTKVFERKIPLSSDGYAALVKALSTGWQDEERDFASKIN